ncbi:MAG: hypothetical protein ACYSWS_06565 [Planctomycetota bacterium]
MTAEKEKTTSLIKAIKERIKYLETNDYNNEYLELLKKQISNYISKESKNLN